MSSDKITINDKVSIKIDGDGVLLIKTEGEKNFFLFNDELKAIYKEYKRKIFNDEMKGIIDENNN